MFLVAVVIDLLCLATSGASPLQDLVGYTS